jgi:hypothetical protein
MILAILLLTAFIVIEYLPIEDILSFDRKELDFSQVVFKSSQLEQLKATKKLPVFCRR